ncbi:MAG: hypothetical protein R2706_12600 [Acidimicrobiales bacterium]
MSMFDPATDEEALASLSPEQRQQAEQMAKDMTAARARLLETEAATIIANHAFGIYELAAIHVTADDPDMTEGRLAIDALEALVSGLSGRLGEAEETLVEALANIKLVYVQRVASLKSEQASGS